MKLALNQLNVPTQHSKFGNAIRNDQNKLGNCALKSDLKSTVRHLRNNEKSVLCSIVRAPRGILLTFSRGKFILLSNCP